MATTLQNLESIASNVAAIARESAIILENGRSVITKETYKDPSSYTESDVIALGNKLTTYKPNYVNYKKYIGNGTLPHYLPVLYLNGDMAGMTKDVKKDMTYKYGPVNGSYFEGTCNCKWQGNSSVGFSKKNYTINKLSPKIDVGWGSEKKYVLKANFIDPSHSRNICCAKLWGDVVKSRTSTDELTTRLKALPSNGGAIDGFPIILVLNNAFNGIYTFNIPKDGWMFGMGNGNNEAILNAQYYSNACLLKQALTKADMEAEHGYSLEYVSDEDDTDWVVTSFNTMYNTLQTNKNANYRSVMDQYLDYNSAIDFYIFTCLMGMWDLVNHNHLLSTYDGVKWFYTPYDMDVNIGLHNGNNISSAKTENPTFANFSGRNDYMNLIYMHNRSELKARYEELRNTVLSEDAIQLKFYQLETSIPEELWQVDMSMWDRQMESHIDHIANITNWYRLRCEYLDKEVESWNV